MVEHPVEQRRTAAWVVGPLLRKTMTAPLELHVSNEAGYFVFTITVYWSVWTAACPAGHRMLQDALARVQQQGWHLIP